MLDTTQRSETLPPISVINGVLGYFIDGRFIPRMAGGETPPNPGEGDPPPKPDDPPAGKDGKPFDPARAQATIDALRAEVKAGKTTATELAAAQAKLKEYEQAQLSETERLTAQLADANARTTDLESKSQTALIRTAVEREAAKLGAVDPEVVYALIDRSDVKLTDAGDVTGADKAVKALLDAKPYLKGDGTKKADKGTPPMPKPNGQQQTREERVAEAQKELRARAPIARL